MRPGHAAALGALLVVLHAAPTDTSHTAFLPTPPSLHPRRDAPPGRRPGLSAHPPRPFVPHGLQPLSTSLPGHRGGKPPAGKSPLKASAAVDSDTAAGRDDQDQTLEGFGSSPEERRRKSVPLARSAGLKLILIGKPCSGKGTQAPMICRRFRCVHVSPGDLLRAEVRIGSELGKQAEVVMKEGRLMPDQLILNLVLKRLEQDDCVQNGWILDGFPRTQAQAEGLQEAGMSPDAVIVLDRPDDVVREWCLGRKTDPSTGIIYHPLFNPAPPGVEEWLQTRDDDRPEVIDKRLEQFRETYRGIVKGFQGTEIVSVNTNQHELNAYADICSRLYEFCPSKQEDVPVVRAEELRRLMLKDIQASMVRQMDVDGSSEVSSKGSPWPRARVTYLDIVQFCNAHSIKGFLPVFAAGKRIGYIGQSLAAELFADSGRGKDFDLALEACDTVSGETSPGWLNLAPHATTWEERTEVMQGVVQRLQASGLLRKEEKNMGTGYDEMVDVWEMMRPSLGGPGLPLMKMERGAGTLFGVPLYGVHINGVVRKRGGEEYVWVAKRSQGKVLYPGLYDQMVSHHQGSRRGGTYVWYPSGSFLYNTVSAAQREAAVSEELVQDIRATGLVSYRYETAQGLVTKVLHVYDMELPENWRPFNGNGEIDGFSLMTIPDMLNNMRNHPENWKPNSMIVNIDLAMRRGYITPDDPDYLELAHSLRVSELHQDWKHYTRLRFGGRDG